MKTVLLRHMIENEFFLPNFVFLVVPGEDAAILAIEHCNFTNIPDNINLENIEETIQKMLIEEAIFYSNIHLSELLNFEKIVKESVFKDIINVENLIICHLYKTNKSIVFRHTTINIDSNKKALQIIETILNTYRLTKL